MYSWMIIDCQWGSTGKGLIAGYLSKIRKPDTIICNFGPNAGHTFIDADDNKFITKQLPNGLVAESVKNIMIGPGSTIKLDILKNELVKFSNHLRGKTVYIHERAGIINGMDQKEKDDATLNQISSTLSGTGTAIADKVHRRNPLMFGREDELNGVLPDGFGAKVKIVDTNEWMRILESAKRVQLESAQGLELGINVGSHYPFCTSRDITPMQIQSDCLFPFKVDDIVGVYRTYPIRVGNTYDAEGNRTGYSGDVYSDQQELEWEQFGVDPERTTVTNKIRRIFTWSWINFEKSVKIVRPTSIFLNFANYGTTKYIRELVTGMENRSDAIVTWLGYGPKETDIHFKIQGE